jgi:dienelactone hydrolase
VRRNKNRRILLTKLIRANTTEKFIDALKLQPPSALLLALEPLRAVSDYLAGIAGPLASLPRGDGHPVIVFPGFAANGAATADLRGRLQQLGYEIYDWEQGINQWPDADFDQWLLHLGEHLKKIHTRHGRSVSLIGWSLGGIYARELAKKYPRRVRQVVTLATPLTDKPDSTHAGWLLTLLNGGAPALGEALLERLKIHPPVPTASIYSQTDGVVAWQGCVGTESARHRNIEVNGVSHMGMVHHPEVLRVVASLLAPQC